MSAVPASVMVLVHAYLAPLLLWFSDQVYDRLLQRARDHLLVTLQAQLDCTAIEHACASYHHTTGPGAPPTHSVPRLVRALLVKYLFDWSWRQLEFQIRYNLLVKWFVGYPIFAAGPDHTTLERFEVWVCKHHHRVFFDETLRQIDAAFPDDRQRPQLGDTFAMRADAAPEAVVRLLRHACERLLRAVASADAVVLEQVTPQLDLAALFGVADEPRAYRLDQQARQARLQATVTAARHCTTVVQTQIAGLSPAARVPITVWLDYVAKILADEVAIECDAAGQVVLVTVLPKDQKGSYRLASATDPGATYRVHGEDQIDLGYNVNVAATTHFIREIQAATGAQPDAVAVPALLQAQIEHHQLCPPKLIYDAAAGTGKTRAQVAQVTQGQTQLVAPLIPYDQRTDRFTPGDFTLAADGQALTCPHGVTTALAYRSGSGEGRNFRFSAHQCTDCPLWDPCRDPAAKLDGLRQVFISDYRPQVEAAQAYNQTDEFKADMRLRPIIEQIIAGLTRHNGARRARRRGQDPADFQAKMSATAFNIKRWMRLLSPRAAAGAAQTGRA